MTASPESSSTIPPTASPENMFLEQLFFLGYAKSGQKTVYKDDKLELIVEFRTLTPTEIRDVFENVGKFNTGTAQAITTEIEILARAIVTINGMPLILDTKDRESFFTRMGHQPSPLDMARMILMEKFKSMHVLDIMYEAYNEFAESVAQSFEDVKKKLKSPTV
jgi:hypothetical protein